MYSLNKIKHFVDKLTNCSKPKMPQNVKWNGYTLNSPNFQMPFALKIFLANL